MAIAILAFMTLSVSSCQPAHTKSHGNSESIATRNIKVTHPEWSKEELRAIAQTLAGDCYDDKELDKRRVCEVILNRVSNRNFPNTIIEVLTTPRAFNGYWQQSRPISESDYAVAEQALQDWYDGECRPLSDWYFFCEGSKRENIFRSDF